MILKMYADRMKDSAGCGLRTPALKGDSSLLVAYSYVTTYNLRVSVLLAVNTS
jgi:hypothetical protein